MWAILDTGMLSGCPLMMAFLTVERVESSGRSK
jgi:hypothetical protein